VAELIDGSELVFNLAAKISIDPREASQLEAPNVGAAAVVRACLGAARLGHSPIHALSTHDGPIDETAPWRDPPVRLRPLKARAEREVLAGSPRACMP
jgi:hypothetical protein